MNLTEKLGSFYLGKVYDLEKKKIKEDLLLYDAKDLTTHGVCVGMTGSGKTGLCVTLLEEAAIDGVPAIAIDPKGDLGNLLLTFPDLRPGDFRPWIDSGEAARKGHTPEEYARVVADRCAADRDIRSGAWILIPVIAGGPEGKIIGCVVSDDIHARLTAAVFAKLDIVSILVRPVTIPSIPIPAV